MYDLKCMYMYVCMYVCMTTSLSNDTIRTTGNTKYHLDSNGLVERHVEQWDVSVLDAFLSTLLPGLGYGAPPAPPAREYSEMFFSTHTQEIT